MADLEGFDELLRALDETTLSLGEKRQGIAKALRNGSKPIAQEYRNRIAVRTGRGRESISVSVVDQTATGAEAQIGPRLFHPKFGELGTSHEPARPTLGPSFDGKQEEAVKLIGDTLGDVIEDAFYG